MSKLLFLLPLCAAALAASGGVVVHVSPTGDDAGDGSAARPVRTLAKARDVARQTQDRAGLAVELAPGYYALDAQLSFDKRDDGVTWRAAQRGAAIVGGACALEWKTPAADDPHLAAVPAAVRGRIRVATIPGKGALPGFEGGFGQPNAYPFMLLRNGARLPLATWPNAGYSYYPGGTVDFETFQGEKGAPKRPETVAVKVSADAERLARWARESDIWIWSAWKFHWADSCVKLRGVDPAAKTLAVPGKSIHYGVAQGSSQGGVFTLRNAFCEIDADDEWAVDRAARRVYLLPGKDGVADVRATCAFNLVVADGASDLAFDGLVFEGARGDALVLRRCTNAVLRACAVRSSGGYGVKVGGGRNCRVEGCDVYDVGEGGISLSGGVRETLTPSGHVVDNCHVHHYGRQVYNYRPGVTLAGVGNRCTHNLIHHARHAGIILSGNDQYVGWNVIHDVCQGNFDCGAIYLHTKTHWSDRGNVVEWNMIHMVGPKRGGGCVMAYYVDGWQSGTTVRHNIASRASHGVYQNGGNDNVYACNLVLCCASSVERRNLGLVGGKKPYPTLGGIGKESLLYRNLVKERALFETPLWRARYPHLLDPLAEPDPIKAHNSFWCVATNNVATWSGKMIFQDSDQMDGRETRANNTMLDGDPGFVDYAGFNWELREDAPARKILGGGTRWAEMGLYASPSRVSPPVKLGEGVTPVAYDRSWPVAMTTVRAALAGTPPKGTTEYATNLVDATFMRTYFTKGNVVSAPMAALDADGDWRHFSYTFTPTFDTTARLSVEGWRGEMTAYDDFEVTGGELLADGTFETDRGWSTAKPTAATLALVRPDPRYGILGAAPGSFAAHGGGKMLFANVYISASAQMKVKGGVPVTISFWARAYQPPETPHAQSGETPLPQPKSKVQSPNSK